MEETTDTTVVLARVKQEWRAYRDDAGIEDANLDTAFIDFVVGAKAAAGPGLLRAALSAWCLVGSARE